MEEFFRHCPGCGKRFHVKLVRKEDLGSYGAESQGPLAGVRGATPRQGVALVREGPTLYYDTKEFAYHYKCQHCGHEWTETRLEEKPVEADIDPIND